MKVVAFPRAMASTSSAVELNFAGLPIDDVFSSNGIIPTLKRYDKFLEVYMRDPVIHCLRRLPKTKWSTTI